MEISVASVKRKPVGHGTTRCGPRSAFFEKKFEPAATMARREPTVLFQTFALSVVSLETAGVISVIIPAYNEAKALPATLDQLATETRAHEVIVVDGGSTDATCEIARSYAGVQLATAPKGRASQMNAGARLATGHCLLFLHADTTLPPGALTRLDALCSKGKHCEAGGFHHRFTGDDWRLRLISWLHNTRCRLTRIFYGDQAMFVSRELFWRLGGFPPEPILEDLLFSEKLKRATRPVLLREYVLTDSRKFVQQGITRSFVRVLVILLCHQLHLPIAARSFFEDVR
jgi:rSAM/selenodomain-associated transferase 2